MSAICFSCSWVYQFPWISQWALFHDHQKFLLIFYSSYFSFLMSSRLILVFSHPLSFRQIPLQLEFVFHYGIPHFLYFVLHTLFCQISLITVLCPFVFLLHFDPHFFGMCLYYFYCVNLLLFLLWFVSKSLLFDFLLFCLTVSCGTSSSFLCIPVL